MNQFETTHTTQPADVNSPASEAITDLKASIAKLKTSENRFRNLSTQLQIGIVVQLPSSEIVFSNPKALELLDLSHDQLVGKTSLDPDWNVIHPDGSAFPGHTHPVPQAIDSKRPVHNVEMGVYRPNKRDRVWLLVNADPQLNPDGSVREVVCTFSDLTERHLVRQAQDKAEESQRIAEVLHERNEFTQAVLNSVSAEIAVLSKDGVIVAVNEPWQRFAGANRLATGELPRHAGVGDNFLVACGSTAACSADQTDASCGIQAVLDGRSAAFTLEYPCHSPQEQRWFCMNVTPLNGNADRGVVISHTDITQRKLSELAQAAKDTALREAQHMARVGSWHWDAATDENVVSDELRHIFGRDHIPKFTEQCGTLYPTATWETLNQAVQKAVLSGVGYDLELPAMRGDGTPIWINTRCDPVCDANHTVVALRGTVQDITERKHILIALQEREQQLMRVIEGSNQGYWDWNLQTLDFKVSARWEEMLGYRAGEMNVSLAHWADHVHPDDLSLALDSIDKHLKGETANHEMEMRLKTKSGSWCWIASRGRIVTWSADGKPLMMAGTHTDITERKNFELAQREAATVFSSSYEGIMVVSPQFIITKVNPAFTRITGYSAEEAIGQSPQILSSGKHDAMFFKQLWSEVHSHGFWSGEIWDRRKNGELYSELLSISAVRCAEGGIQHYVGVFSDISKFKTHQEELERAAHYDPLTGSPNRRLLSDRLEQAIHRATRSGRSLALCFLDLDGFKAINVQHGPLVGDQLLLGVNENLKRILRSDDTLARLGGDEFVLLLSEIASPEECVLILDRVLQAVSQPVTVGQVTLVVTASIGVSLYPDDNVDADTLLRHADQAMFQAKEAGKNRYNLFNPENDRKAQTHRQFLEVLRHALANHEFVLFYQPKVNLITGQVMGAEALIRWRHPEKGLIAPAEFLPHIDGSDLETPLGEWVIQTALAQAATWHQQGMPLCVSANISAHHLLQPGFHDYLAKTLAAQPRFLELCFELEVLETAAIADMEDAVSILRHCRELGVHFSLDDFGTGYSSLTYLRKLPIDTLKIDQSFVRGMLDDADDRGIVEGVIRLGETFKRHIVAEGVETMAHAAELLRMGCHLAQGYGVARPMPAEQFLDWCATWAQDAPWRALPALRQP